MKKITLLSLMILSLATLLRAQDIHYSQFYSSPLTLNPALTGVNDCNYRIAANYRNQWKSVTTPYVTPSLSFDINNVLQKVVKSGTLSAGLLLVNDKAGDGDLSNLTVQGSLGYQHSFAADKLHTSIGLQFGYTQKSLDFNKLTWETQFNGSGFDPNITVPFSDDHFSYIDANIGAYASYHASDKADIFGGLAAFHLTTPTETFLGQENQLNMRGVIHLGMRYMVSDKLDLIPQFLYMGQSKDRELNPGLSLKYLFNSDATLYAGAYYRVKDAIIPMVAFEYKKVHLGLSYDVNTSTLNQASNGKGGFEISLGYVGCLSGLVYDKPLMFCPRY